MKIKLQAVEGYHTTVWYEPVEIETDDYPQLEGMSKEEATEYLKKHAQELEFFYEGKGDSEWTVYEELLNQDVEYTKEKNFDTSIEEAYEG